jgi:hypothetical protein
LQDGKKGFTLPSFEVSRERGERRRGRGGRGGGREKREEYWRWGKLFAWRKRCKIMR